jgi:hypothetical protein
MDLRVHPLYRTGTASNGPARRPTDRHGVQRTNTQPGPYRISTVGMDLRVHPL